MIRRQARQRRDYLYRRAQALLDAETATRRAALKSSLATGKPLDPSIANDRTLRADYKYDASQPDGDAQKSSSSTTTTTTTKQGLDPSLNLDLDDEYAHLSGLSDPRVLVTTSRSPSTRLSAFAKEMRLLMPTSIRLNRGNLVLGTLVSSARAAGLTDVALLHERRGTPAALTLSHLPHGPTASFALHNVALRADIPRAARGSVSEAYPRLVLDGFATPLGRRVARMLAHLFPPREAVGPATPARALGNRVVTVRNREDWLEIRHHVFVLIAGGRGVELAEVGPRMTMRLFEIRGGVIGEEGDVEWHLNQYTRTAGKKNYL